MSSEPQSSIEVRGEDPTDIPPELWFWLHSHLMQEASEPMRECIDAHTVRMIKQGMHRFPALKNAVRTYWTLVGCGRPIADIERDYKPKPKEEVKEETDDRG